MHIASDRFLAIAAPGFLILLGVVQLWRRRSRIVTEISFTLTYLQAVQRYLESDGADPNVYAWLVQQSERMQRELGSGGIISYRPAGASYMMNSYPAVLNLVPEMRREFEHRGVLSGTHHAHEIGATLQEILLRHAGSLDEDRTLVGHELRNPIAWIRTGFGAVLAIPLWVLSSVGVIRPSAVLRVTTSAIFRVVSGLATLLGLIGSVMTIVVGWQEFARALASLLP